MSDAVVLKKALFAIKKLKRELQERDQTIAKPIAIIGMGCRFSQAINPEEYWQLLLQGKQTITHLPPERRRLLTHQPKNWQASFLNDVTLFDAGFFGLTPREAVRMDPQQRMLLEVAFEALEDAGLSIESLTGSNTGVFASLYTNQFAYLQNIEDAMDALYVPTGNALSMAANRLAYFFDWQGPNLVVDTACSSSLVAMHLACMQIQQRACDIALVCAANINLFPFNHELLTQAKMLAPDAQCKTFAAEANGYVQGEGVAVVVLKPLAKALLDHDRVYAVICGSAINQDGKTNGLTAPNGLQQEKVIKSACVAASIKPADITYVECHGTGTFLGDPIEVQALGEVLNQNRHLPKPCWISSVKTNIGHLEPAAGIASVIKTALVLKHATIPPHLNFSTPNPHIDFAKYQFQVPNKIESWVNENGKRYAGVSSFGFGGTNAHLIMRDLSDEEQVSTNAHESSKVELFTLSAKHPLSLQAAVNQWCHYFENNPAISLAQVCYNLHVRRSHFFYRLVIAADSTSDLLQQLNTIRHQALENITNTATLLINLNKEKLLAALNHPLASLMQDYINRAPLDWKTLEYSRSYSVLDMPSYVWQHKPYWAELKNPGSVKNYPFTAVQLVSPLKQLQFEFKLSLAVMPEIADTLQFLHAGYYLEMLAIATTHLFTQTYFSLENTLFLTPIHVPEDQEILIQLILEPQQAQLFNFTFYSKAADAENWTVNTTGSLNLTPFECEKNTRHHAVEQDYSTTGTLIEVEQRVKAMLMPFGDSIQWTENYIANFHEILCQFRAPGSAQQSSCFKLKIHVGIVDACVQALFMLLPSKLIKPYVAAKIKKLNYYGVNQSTSFKLWGQLNYLLVDGKEYTGNFTLLDTENHKVLECQDLVMVQLSDKISLNNVNQSRNKINLASLPLHSRQATLVDYLLEQTANLFACAKQDISIHTSLRDLGLDSLMAIVLRTVLETDLNINYSLAELLKGPTLAEVADIILTMKNIPTASAASPWIMGRNKNHSAKIRLFCFPYGGGGASIYSQWQAMLPHSIEVCPIQLPGREDRIQEPLINQVPHLINHLLENLQSEFDLPFAFFGHSFGSLIGFELTRKLRQYQLPMPAHLFASAFPDPRKPTKSLDNLIADLSKLGINLFDYLHASQVARLTPLELNQLAKLFNTNGLLEYSNQKLTKEIIQMMLPIFASDMNIVKSYVYRDEAPLDIPISVFLGVRDTWVSYSDQLSWSDHTHRKCEFHEFSSGHLFIKDIEIQKQMLQKIAAVLIS